MVAEPPGSIVGAGDIVVQNAEGSIGRRVEEREVHNMFEKDDRYRVFRAVGIKIDLEGETEGLE